MIRRDLHEERLAADDRVEDPLEMLRPLQLAQRRRVRRRDIDHHGVGVRRELRRSRRVVLGGGLDRDVAILADVDEERDRRCHDLQPLGDGIARRRC